MSWTTQLIEQERQALDMRWTQGDSVSFSLRFGNLASYVNRVWTAQVRSSQSRTATLVATFTINAAVSGADLLLTLTLPPAANQVAHSTLCWDLQSDNGAGDIRTWIGGFVFVVADVTEVGP